MNDERAGCNLGCRNHGLFGRRRLARLLRQGLDAGSARSSVCTTLAAASPCNVLLSSQNWECKLIISLWQYSILANYSWILMEGLYLHNLIFLALFSDNSAITLYVALGWGESGLPRHGRDPSAAAAYVPAYVPHGLSVQGSPPAWCCLGRSGAATWTTSTAGLCTATMPCTTSCASPPSSPSP